jgi:YidC/Oxa1 family membrane protein insertase
MEQQKSGGIAKYIFVGLAVFLVIQFGWPYVFGDKDAPKTQPFSDQHFGSVPSGDRPEEKVCELTDQRAAFQLSTRGGTVKSAKMLDAKYAGIELVSTSKEQRMPLRSGLRAPGAEDGKQQVDFDSLDFELGASDARSCTFVFKSAQTEVKKVVALTERPFELAVDVTLKNLAAEAKSHRFTLEQSSWRTKKETESSFWDLGRRPEWLTDVVTHTDKETERHMPGTFAPGEFKEEGFTDEKWLRASGKGIWAAVSTNYFASTVIDSGGAAPHVETLIEDGEYYNLHPEDPRYGHLYRARIVADTKELGPGEEATYSALAFMGPKERDVLGVVGGGDKDRFGTKQLIDLGMFGVIGEYLVAYTIFLAKLVGSWGWAICLLTLSVKLLVFPLQLPQLKVTVAMRRLKPQIDKINEQYKDDLTQKTVALQELYRGEGVNQFRGCLPLMLQMPVWFALYQALSSAVELYHTPFLAPLIPDLTSSDPYHVIPLILGASSFLQQKLMPPQGMDPAQARMMLYMMPAIFTVMMFFMPAGLGVYMLTNTWLGIIQQVLVEKWVQSRLATASATASDGSAIQVREVTKKKKDEAPAIDPDAGIGKGKVRARG